MRILLSATLWGLLSPAASGLDITLEPAAPAVDLHRMMVGDGKVYNQEWNISYTPPMNFGTSLYNATLIAPASSLQDAATPFQKFRHDLYLEYDGSLVNIKLGVQNTFDSGQSRWYENRALVNFRIRF